MDKYQTIPESSRITSLVKLLIMTQLLLAEE